jgi:hypothetical protein
MAPFRISTVIVFAALVYTTVSPASAQTSLPVSDPSVSPATVTAPSAPAATAPADPMLLPTPIDGSGGIVRLSTNSVSDAESSAWVASSTVPGNSGSDSHWFAGADFLFVRPHFSEATAFAQGTQSASSMHITAQELDFQYSPSFRVFAGYRFEGSETELRFTYTRLTAQTESDAGNFSAGHFAVDPFGNVAGVAVVVDPNSALFGQPLVGGDHIQASATVDANVFDLDLIKPLLAVCGGWEFKYTAGVRIAQIHQLYQSVVSDSGSFFSGGEYAADFTGAGPRVGVQAQRYFGQRREFSLFANSYGSLLVGEYDMHFSQTTTSPAYQATQDTDAVRLLPVAEAEIGAGWSPISWCNVSAGWLFQAWFDLGASGGTFGGFYTVTENSNIMAFEGFFLRAEVTF